MKKQKVSEFIKGKSFYLVLLTGLCAVIVIALVYTNVGSSNKENGLVDLNQPIPNVVSNENTDDNSVNNDKTNYDTASAKIQNDILLENDIVNENEVDNESTEVMSNSANKMKSADKTKGIVDTKNIKAVEADSSKTTSLNFHEEDGLKWPIQGNVLLNFNMEHSIYFETLRQYKVNPAIIIQGTVGEEVLSATKGIVTDLVENEETGLTMTMSIGSGYKLVYGQLEDAKVKVGDTVSEGEIIGYVAEPTKYYIVEGSNLYFQVLKDDEAINPMLLLKE